MAIIVGDIHGDVDKVKAFLAYKPQETHVALGDYLDSYTEPPERQLEALRMLMDSDAVMLWGNHDLAYLQRSPYDCISGYQAEMAAEYRQQLMTGQNRFQAAFAVDGWLCTHAGVHKRILRQMDVSTGDVDTIAAHLNQKLAEALECGLFDHAIFNIGMCRGGYHRFGGIFWHDFRYEEGLATEVKQIFGHTRTEQPELAASYVALDTSGNTATAFVFDTSENRIAALPLPSSGLKLYTELAGVVYARIRDLPTEERGPFMEALQGKTVPMIEGVPQAEQDAFYPWDYQSWKRRR